MQSGSMHKYNGQGYIEHDGEREAKYNWEGELRMMARESMSIYGKQEPEYDGEGDPA